MQRSAEHRKLSAVQLRAVSSATAVMDCSKMKHNYSPAASCALAVMDRSNMNDARNIFCPIKKLCSIW
jgi:hypothetical protein